MTQLTELEKNSDGQPKEIVPQTTTPRQSIVSQNNDMARRYNLSERLVWSKLPNWKRAVIIKCKLTNRNDRILDDYAQEIIMLAETKTILPDNLPPVPPFTFESEAEETTSLNPS